MKRSFDIDATMDAICERIAKGESLVAICKDKDMPSISLVFRWLADDEKTEEREIVDKYARAREAQAEFYASEIIDIADDKSGDCVKDEESGRVAFNPEFAARSRIRIDARKWIASKLLPKKYGEKLDMTSGGNPLPAPTILLAHAQPQPEAD